MGISIDVSEVPLKAPSPIDSSPSGRVIESIALQYANAQYPMDLRVEGSSMV